MWRVAPSASGRREVGLVVRITGSVFAGRVANLAPTTRFAASAIAGIPRDERVFASEERSRCPERRLLGRGRQGNGRPRSNGQT